MTATLDTLVKETRRFMRDYPVPVSALTVSLSSSATSITVADTTVFAQNWAIEIDYEPMLLSVSNSTTNNTVIRGWAGTTAVSHAVGATVLVRPGFFTVEIIDQLNAAKDEMYPYVYKPILDTSLMADGATYEFTVPVTIRHLSKVELEVTGDLTYRKVNDWDVIQGPNRTLKFRRQPAPGTLRLSGFGTFSDLVNSTDTVDTLFPPNAVHAMTLGAASKLLGSGEAGRSRQDVGTRDDRESANKPGNAIALANQLERRFEKALARVAMPPMPTHIVSVL